MQIADENELVALSHLDSRVRNVTIDSIDVKLFKRIKERLVENVQRALATMNK